MSVVIFGCFVLWISLVVEENVFRGAFVKMGLRGVESSHVKNAKVIINSQFFNVFIIVYLNRCK